MKWYSICKFGGLFFLILLTACVQQTLKSPATQIYTSSPGDMLVKDGDDLFDKGDMEQALKRYVSYSIQFPDGQYMDRALFRIARIYQLTGQSEEARAFYQKLLDGYGLSAYAGEARLAVVDMLIAAQRNDEALAEAIGYLEADLPADIQQALRQRLAGIYRQTGNPGRAALNEYLIYATTSGAEKEHWAQQLKQTLSQLDADDIELVWDHIKDPGIRGDLMYRYAVVQTVLEHYDDALEVLTAFRKAYPTHAFAEQAATLEKTLIQNLTFKPYTVGCLLPLSGRYKLYGTRALNGIEFAMSLAQQGESHPPIRLVVKDTGSDDAQAVRAVRELANAGVGAILGPIITAPAVVQEAQKLQIPTITFTQKPDIAATGDYVFRHFITPQGQVQTLVGYFINSVGLHDFAILYPKETYGDTFMTLFWDEVVRQGGRVVGVEAYESEHTDFAVSIKKLVGTYYQVPKDLQAPAAVRVKDVPYFQGQSLNEDRLSDTLPDPVNRLTGLYFQSPFQDRVRGPAIGRIREEKGDDPIVDFDVLFIPDAPKKAGLIIPQLAYYDVNNVYLAGTNLWHSSQLIEMSKDYVRNAVMVDGFFKDSTSESVVRFVDAFRKIYDREPGIIDAFAFDTANLLFDLLSQGTITMRHQLRDALLEANKDEGVTGPVAFDNDGEAIKHLSLLRVRNGQFVEIPRP